MNTDMRDIGQGTIRRIDWQELFPVFFLLRALRVSLGLRPIFLAAFAVMIISIFGVFVNSIVVYWETRNANMLLEDESLPMTIPAQNPIKDVANVKLLFLPVEKPISFGQNSAAKIENTVLVPWSHFGQSFVQIFKTKTSVLHTILAVFWFSWLLGVWTLFGGAITRTAALKLTLNQHESMNQVSQFLNTKWKSYIGAVLLPLLAVFACALPMFLARLCFTVPVLDIVTAVFFPVILLLAFFNALLLIGLFFGFPLMFAAVSTEGSDAFDAVSRAYSYVYQRPLHYLFYLAISLFLGFVAWIFFSIFVDTTIILTVYFGGFSDAGLQAMQSGNLARGVGIKDISSAESIIQLWISCMQFAKIGFIFSYFWVSTTAIYLLLRKSVDDVQYDVVK